jgi:hypothetical protein
LTFLPTDNYFYYINKKTDSLTYSGTKFLLAQQSQFDQVNNQTDHSGQLKKNPLQFPNGLKTRVGKNQGQSDLQKLIKS